MATFYQMYRTYRENIEPIFEQAKKSVLRFSKPETVEIHEQSHSISLMKPPRGVTHGERVDVTLTSENGMTTLCVRSESLIKEFDCGNNHTNVDLIFTPIDTKFQHCAVSSIKRGTTKTRKMLPIAFAVVAILVLALLGFALKGLFGTLSGGNDNEECGVCDGVGMVPNDDFGYSKCPYCKGTGVPPQ